METILTYNVKVTHNIKISYIKQQININIKEINIIKKYKKIYAMSEKSCPKSVPGLTNMPKKIPNK